MLIKTVLAYLSLIVFTINASAQPEYDRARRQRELDEANQRERDKQNAENNRPVESKWGSATGVFNRPSSTGKASSGWNAETQRQFLANKKKERDARMAEISKQMEEQKLRDGGRTASYEQYYKSLGYFNELEIYRLTDLTKKLGSEVNPYADYYLSFGDRYKEYLNKADTGSFYEVMDALEPFAILPHTALTALKKLQAKFPAKQFEIDMATRELLKNYYNDIDGLGGVTAYAYGNGFSWREPGYFEWADLFIEMGKNYPDSIAKDYAMNIYSSIGGYYDPFTITLKQLDVPDRSMYKTKREASKKRKEVSEAREALMPKVNYWKGVLGKK